jgi:hypothetical protein
VSRTSTRNLGRRKSTIDEQRRFADSRVPRQNKVGDSKWHGLPARVSEPYGQDARATSARVGEPHGQDARAIPPRSREDHGRDAFATLACVYEPHGQGTRAIPVPAREDHGQDARATCLTEVSVVSGGSGQKSNSPAGVLSDATEQPALTVGSGGPADVSAGDSEKTRATEKLLQIAAGARPFRRPDGQYSVSIAVDGHQECHALESPEVVRWLTRR